MKQRFRSSGFFVELIFTILFFAIACSIIVQIFAKASLMSQKALEEQGAAAQCQTLCETIKVAPNVQGALPAGSYEENKKGEYQIYYSNDWQPVPKDKAVFTIVLKVWKEPQQTGTLLKMNFEAKKEQVMLYNMKATQYLSTQEVL